MAGRKLPFIFPWQEDPHRIFGLDLMRALAILMVLVAHSCGLLFPVSGHLEAFSYGGFGGVEMFFVLSGYLIGSILLRKIAASPQFDGGGLRRFWVRRWFRTLPLYYLVLGINFIWTAHKTGESVIDGRYFYFWQGMAGDLPDFFVESWSLAVEEWFYLLFPLLLWGMARLTGNLQGKKIIGVTLIFGLAVVIDPHRLEHRPGDFLAKRNAHAYPLAPRRPFVGRTGSLPPFLFPRQMETLDSSRPWAWARYDHRRLCLVLLQALPPVPSPTPPDRRKACSFSSPTSDLPVCYLHSAPGKPGLVCCENRRFLLAGSRIPCICCTYP